MLAGCGRLHFDPRGEGEDIPPPGACTTLGLPSIPALPVAALSVAAADFTGDGRPDIAAINTENRLQIYIADGGGLFHAGPEYPVERTGVSSIVVAATDVDGNGVMDLVTTLESSVTIWIGGGDGSFTATTNYLTGLLPSAIAHADFNGDGRIDLATVDSGQSPQYTVSVLLGNGDGTFASAVGYPVGNGTRPVAIAAGDVTGDGRLDIVTANYYSMDVALLAGSGTGTFATPAVFATGITPVGIATADLNEDGVLDVIVGGSSPAGGIVVMLGTSAGLSAPTTYPSGGFAVSTADFDEDGALDVVVGAEMAGAFEVFRGNRDGTLQPATVVSTSYALRALAIADLDSDGHADIVGAGLSTAPILGNGDGTFRAPTRYTTSGYATGMAIADFDGDGRPDVAVGDYTDAQGTVTIWLAAANGALQETRKIPAYEVTRLGFGDIDGDHDIDLAYTTTGAAVGVLRNNGDATFEAFPAMQLDAFDVALGDTDRDGNADLILALGNAVGVARSNGDGTFQAVASELTPFFPDSLTVRDIDHDGRSDVAVVYGPVAAFSIFRAGDDGTLQPRIDYPRAATSVTFGDVDLDGNPDVVLGTIDSIYFYRGMGDGAFVEAGSFPLGAASRSPNRIGIGDIDGDGIPEIVALAGDHVDVLIGPTFGAPRSYPTGYARPQPPPLVLPDLDRDGRHDIVIQAQDGAMNVLLARCL